MGKLKFKIMYELYVDAAKSGQKPPAVYAYALVYRDKVVLEGCEIIPASTIPAAELTAFLEGAMASYRYKDLVAYSDCQYVVKGWNEWGKKWKSNGFKTAAGEDIENKDLWVKTWHNTDNISILQWVKAHDGNRWNEYVDNLARTLLDKYLSKEND